MSVGCWNGRAKHSVVSYLLRREFLAECFAPTIFWDVWWGGAAIANGIDVVGKFIRNTVEIQPS
jgi:hypothetical protein